MLASVEIVVSAFGGVQLLVIAALKDAPLFDDEYLVGAPDGRKPMGYDERGASLHQVRETGLDESFGFGIEARCRFIKNQDAGIGENLSLIHI